MHSFKCWASEKQGGLTLCVFNESDWNLDIIMMPETWHQNKNEVMRMPNYTSFFINRVTQHGGGLLLQIKCNFQYQVPQPFSVINNNIEILTVKCKQHIFSVIHRQPDANLAVLEIYGTFFSYINENKCVRRWFQYKYAGNVETPEWFF